MSNLPSVEIQDEFTEVYGLFSTYELACQCHEFNAGRGSLVILPVPINKFFDCIYISDGENNPPLPKSSNDAYNLFWVVSSSELFYGVFSDEKTAKKLKRSVWDKMYKESGYNLYQEPRVFKYVMMDLVKFKPDISDLFDKKIEPFKLEEYPFFCR
jgi:hypothetical protein